METENRAWLRSSNESKQFPECARKDELIVKLARFYSVMGNQPTEPGALALMAEVLCQSASDEQIAHAMTRCCRECRYSVRLSDFLQRIPGQEVPAIEAEMRAAWDMVTKYVSRWARWNSERDRAYIEQGAPQLSARISDAVRRSGGWTAYLAMDADGSFPFLQKRFFEEFLAWTAIERVDLSHMLNEIPQPKRLTAPAVPAEAKPAKADVSEIREQLASLVKRMPERPSQAKIRQLRERKVAIVVPAMHLSAEQIKARREVELAEIEEATA